LKCLDYFCDDGESWPLFSKAPEVSSGSAAETTHANVNIYSSFPTELESGPGLSNSPARKQIVARD